MRTPAASAATSRIATPQPVATRSMHQRRRTRPNKGGRRVMAIVFSTAVPSDPPICCAVVDGRRRNSGLARVDPMGRRC